MEVVNITNNVMKNCTLTQRKENNNDQKETDSSQLPRNENENKNDTTDTKTLKTEDLKGDHRNDIYPTRDKIQDQELINRDTPRMSRSSVGPRFKKNADTRHRSTQHFTSLTNQYSSNESSNSKPPKLEKEMKGDDANMQHSHLMSQQMHTPTNAINSYQIPFMQHSIYTGLPYYGNEAEGFVNSYYPPNTGFFPIPCLPHSEIPDNNSMQPYSPHLCPGMDYTQAYSGLCPPYVCAQPAPYTIPPQNVQEHWYAVAGQPHYMQYAPVMPVTAETTCNGIAQSASPNVSP